MFGHSHLSVPDEIILEIIDSLPQDRRRHEGIEFADNQVLHLSQVNHHLRRICLPLLYQRILVTLTSNGLTPGSMHAAELDRLRRYLERRPLLASLIKCLEIRSGENAYQECVFDSLSLLPNVSRIYFPDNIHLDPDFLSVINSHPTLHTAHWTRPCNFNLPPETQMSLSRIRVIWAGLPGGHFRWKLDLWSCLSRLGLRVLCMTVDETTESRFFGLTYPELRRLKLNVDPHYNYGDSEPLEWLPSFLERHPGTMTVAMDLKRGWDGLLSEVSIMNLKNFPGMKSFGDEARRLHLLPLFMFESVTATREKMSSKQIAISSAILKVRLSRMIPDVIRCFGTMPALTELTLHLLPITTNPLIDVTDFVSVFHENLQNLRQLVLYSIHRALDFRDLHHQDEIETSVIFEDKRDEGDILVVKVGVDRVPATQIAEMVRLIAVGLPRLELVVFHDEDNCYSGWKFFVSKCDQGRVRLKLDVIL